jgi:uncharacterized protein (DUF427 family)
MSLVAAHGPLSDDPRGWFSTDLPADLVYVEPHPRRVQARIDGRVVIDTEQALLVHRRGHPLSFAFPVHVVGDLPHEAITEAPGYVRVPWDAVDEWHEEGRRLVHYPPNPYHRVDCRPTSRRLTVVVNEVAVVDTTRTVAVFETGLAPRLYVDPAHVRTDLLRRTDTTSYCNYKGRATYWSVVVGDVVIEDAAWSYDAPLAESAIIAAHLSFDETKVDVVAELPQP